jgi:hypothetical protein
LIERLLEQNYQTHAYYNFVQTLPVT